MKCMPGSQKVKTLIAIFGFFLKTSICDLSFQDSRYKGTIKTASNSLLCLGAVPSSLNKLNEKLRMSVYIMINKNYKLRTGNHDLLKGESDVYTFI